MNLLKIILVGEEVESKVMEFLLSNIINILCFAHVWNLRSFISH